MLMSILSHLDRKDHAQARQDLNQTALELQQLRATAATVLSRADAVDWARVHPSLARELRAIFDLLREGSRDVVEQAAA